MVARVREQPLTGVVGPSGVGKSSFVRAGVGPALKASGERWDVDHDAAGPAAAGRARERRPARARRASGPTSRADRRARRLLDRLAASPACLGTLLRARARSRGRPTSCCSSISSRSSTRWSPTARSVARSPPRLPASPTMPRRRCASSCRCARTFSIASARTRSSSTSCRAAWCSCRRRTATGLREALVQPIELVGYRFEIRRDGRRHARRARWHAGRAAALAVRGEPSCGTRAIAAGARLTAASYAAIGGDQRRARDPRRRRRREHGSGGAEADAPDLSRVGHARAHARDRRARDLRDLARDRR